MKKVLSLLLIACLTIVFSTAVFAEEGAVEFSTEVNEVNDDVAEVEVIEEEGITVFIDEQKINFDVPPQLINGRTMVPVRFIFEAFGLTLQFDEETGMITASKINEQTNETTYIILQINNTKAFVGDKEVELDSPAVLVDGRTLVPVRFIAESLGCQVDWNAEKQQVIITTAANTEEAKQENDTTETAVTDGEQSEDESVVTDGEESETTADDNADVDMDSDQEDNSDVDNNNSDESVED